MNKDRLGLDDPRSCQPQELQRLRDELRALPETQTLDIVLFLENVASMPKSVRQQYDEWLECPPVLSDAVWCGWVHRKRLYWLCAEKGHISASCQPPPEWAWECSGETPFLKFVGRKPLPSRVSFAHGFQCLLNPDEVKQSGESAMYTFTREFYHPPDRCAQASAAAVQRFFEDGCRFPPPAYEEHNLVWRGEKWRTLEPTERAQLMGWPALAVAPARGRADLKRQRQNSFIGNGFHLFTLVALFSMLPQILSFKLPQSLSDHDSRELQLRVSHTLWEPGRLEHFPGLLKSPDVVQGMQLCFPDCPVPSGVWNTLAELPLWDLQSFSAWCRCQGLTWQVLGPTHLSKVDRSALFAGLSGQRYAAGSARGLDHVLPPGLGCDTHIKQALQLPSPFRLRPWPDPDVSFVIYTIQVWQKAVPGLARYLSSLLKKVIVLLEPLELELSRFRVPSAQRVAQQKRPGFVAFLTAILRWPDLDQPQQLLLGYPIVGDVQPSGVFRPVLPPAVSTLDAWLQDAQTVVDRICQSKPPLHAADILSTTLEEVDKGFCSSLVPREVIDRKFGVGKWRPLERFLIIQPDGKKRVIDNARKTGHNASTSLAETISTVHIDFVAAVARQTWQALERAQVSPHSSQSDWLRMRLGTDDLPDAYRGLPVAPGHQPFSIIAVHDAARGWLFTELYGLAYGLESAVVQFNRFPLLGVAASRRLTCSIAAAYFDDELAIEMIADVDVSQTGLRLIFTEMGAPPQQPKGFIPMPDRYYLGASVHVGDFWPNGWVRFQPKFSTMAKVVHKLDTALQTKSMSRDETNKLRGDLQWMFSMCAGFLGRIANPVLSCHQRGDRVDLTSEDERILRLLRIIASHAKPRYVCVGASEKPRTTVYSDASFEDGRLRLGWIIFPPIGQPRGGSTLVPPEVLASWTPEASTDFPWRSALPPSSPSFAPSRP